MKQLLATGALLFCVLSQAQDNFPPPRARTGGTGGSSCTGYGCTYVADSFTLSDGGIIAPASEPFVAIDPWFLYDDGGVVAGSIKPAGAGQSGYLTNVGGVFVVDAGVVAIGGGYLGGSRHLTGYFAALALANGTITAETRMTAPATFTRYTVRIVSAGADGTHNFTADVYDLTTSTVVCVTGNITCNTAASTVGVACAASVATSDDVQLRVNDGSCLTTAPSLNLTAEYQ